MTALAMIAKLSPMRTTVTLDDDVVAALRQAERERGVSFKEALNSAVRAGLAATSGVPRRPYSVRPFRAALGAGIDLRSANRLVADIEDDELVRKLELGK